MMRKNPATHRVVALAVPDVVMLDLAIPAQIFGHPEESNRYRFDICAERKGPVPTTSGVPLLVSSGLAALDSADTVVVPGYAPLTEPSGRTLAALRRASRRGARIMSVCTGAFALAAAGLLDGRPATTHWQDAADLAERYPSVHVDPGVLYIDDGSVLTSAGVCAGIDLCLHVVRSDHGAEAASRVARRLVVAPHRSGGQAQFIQRQVASQGQGLGATCAWAVERLSEPLTVTDLARHAGYATRTFSRRFVQETGMTPQRWLTSHRVAEARRLLEVSDLPVSRIAARCGLGTAANLRIHVARDAALTPSAYRAAYQGVQRSTERAADDRHLPTHLPTPPDTRADPEATSARTPE
jgi:transcriptional regulator GlxA family with amidase domain